MKSFKKQLKEAVNVLFGEDNAMAERFSRIVLNNVNKENPKEFFTNFLQSGCQSGWIGEFIYHVDCKKIYIRYIDEMEDFKEEMEDDLGEPIPNRLKLPHYTFMCWLCFEEFCYRIANKLWEDEF